MNIRTKLIVLFFYIAIVPMVLLGTALYVTSEKILTNSIMNHLTAITSLQHDRLQELLEQKMRRAEFLAMQSDIVSLMSNTNRRLEITPLRNVISKSDEIRSISIFNPQLILHASVPEHIESHTRGVDGMTTIRDGFWHTKISLVSDDDGRLSLLVATPILRGEERIGILLIEESIRDISAIAESYAGMKETGETLIAHVTSDNSLRYLHQRRFEQSAISGLEPSKDIIYQALLRDAGTSKDFLDYRGEHVFAASRFMYDTGWVVLAKIDRREALFFSIILVNLMAWILPGLVFLTILMAIRLGNSVATPIVLLSKASKKLVSGEDDGTDISIDGTDEIAQLCANFMNMNKTIRMNQTMLKNMVQSKTEQLSHKIGELEKASSIIERVSEEREKFQLAVESSSDAILFAKPDQSIFYVNPSWETLTGYLSNELANKSIFSFQSGETDANVIVSMREALVRGERFQSADIIMQRKNGTTYEAELTLYPVFDAENHVLYYAVMHRDISERKRLEHAKTEFLSLASHELGTPLSKISWTFEVIMDGFKKLSSTQQKLIQTAYECLQQMSQSINRMMLVSRIESHAIHASDSVCDISKLLQELTKKYEAAYSEKEITYTTTSPDNLAIRVDSHLLEEVLSNIIKNAIMYTPEHGNVSVAVTRNDANVSFTITDSGVGIPYSEQSRIFTKLFRAKNAMVIDTDGAGLGLYVSRSLVEILGGSISFTSQEGVGSSFTVSFDSSYVIGNTQKNDAL